jgi:hypothetical protein
MPNFSAAYLNAFHEKVHVMLEQAYTSARPKIGLKTEEVVITQFLVTAMNEWLRDFSTPEEFTSFFVHDNIFVDDSNKYGKHRDIVDIVFEFARPGPRPQYSIEAKRLSRPSNNIGKYVGKDGLGCFIDERYSKSWPVAGMLGYIQTDTEAFWISKLEESLRKPVLKCILRNGKLIEQHNWKQSSLPSWTSKHDRSEEPIDIIHVFLSFN